MGVDGARIGLARERLRVPAGEANAVKNKVHGAAPTCFSRAPMTWPSWAAMAARAESVTDAMIKKSITD